jgi:hypothetical protein
MSASFTNGMASRLGERLRDMKSGRDFSQKARGFDLVLAKKPLIDAAFASLGIILQSGTSGRSIRNQGAYNAGRTAADGVSINQGVTGRAGGGGGRIK